MLTIVRSEKTTLPTAGGTTEVSFTSGKGVGPSGTTPKNADCLLGAVSVRIANETVITAAHVDDVQEIIEESYLTLMIDGVEIVRGPVSEFPGGAPIYTANSGVTDRQICVANGTVRLPLPHKMPVPSNRAILAKIVSPAVDATVKVYVDLQFEHAA